MTRLLIGVAAAAMLATACSGDDDSPVTSGPDDIGATATAAIIGPDASELGEIRFEQGPAGVLMTVDLAGLSAGPHGIHLHAVGACSPDFTAAGGHINPDEVPHGLMNPDGTGGDNGDLPLLFAADDGTARAQFYTERVTVTGGGQPALLDGGGSTVIIHEHADDHVSQPIGGAGGRVGCGVITSG